MANAIIGGLKAAGVSMTEIVKTCLVVVSYSIQVVSDPYEPTRRNLENTYGVKTTEDNNQCVAREQTILILAVKPQVMKTVAEGIAANVQKWKPLVISIAAGITTPDLVKWFLLNAPGGTAKPSIVRCMPNTPALVSEFLHF